MIGAAIVVATHNTHIKDMVDEMDDYIYRESSHITDGNNCHSYVLYYYNDN